MKQAKYYTYRNLNKGGFSVKHRGLVVNRNDSMIIDNGEFRVSLPGRNRVLKDKKRNVHAYIVSDNFESRDFKLTKDCLEVTYNPYKAEFFYIKTSGKRIDKADKILLKDGRAYIIDKY